MKEAEIIKLIRTLDGELLFEFDPHKKGECGMKTKIFEGNTMQEAINACLKAGYIPATIKETYNYKKAKKNKQWLDTRTYFMTGKFKEATIKQLKNLKELYKQEGRLLCLGGGFDGNDLDSSGRFLGVKKK